MVSRMMMMMLAMASAAVLPSVASACGMIRPSNSRLIASMEAIEAEAVAEVPVVVAATDGEPETEILARSALVAALSGPAPDARQALAAEVMQALEAATPESSEGPESAVADRPQS